PVECRRRRTFENRDAGDVLRVDVTCSVTIVNREVRTGVSVAAATGSRRGTGQHRDAIDDEQCLVLSIVERVIPAKGHARGADGTAVGAVQGESGYPSAQGAHPVVRLHLRNGVAAHFGNRIAERFLFACQSKRRNDHAFQLRYAFFEGNIDLRQITHGYFLRGVPDKLKYQYGV